MDSNRFYARNKIPLNIEPLRHIIKNKQEKHKNDNHIHINVCEKNEKNTLIGGTPNWIDTTTLIEKNEKSNK